MDRTIAKYKSEAGLPLFDHNQGFATMKVSIFLGFSKAIMFCDDIILGLVCLPKEQVSISK